MIRERFYWTVITQCLLLHCLTSIKTDTELIWAMPKRYKNSLKGCFVSYHYRGGQDSNIRYKSLVIAKCNFTPKVLKVTKNEYRCGPYHLKCIILKCIIYFTSSFKMHYCCQGEDYRANDVSQWLLVFLDEPGNYCVLKYWPLSVLQFMKMRVVNCPIWYFCIDIMFIDIVDAFYPW